MNWYSFMNVQSYLKLQCLLQATWNYKLNWFYQYSTCKILFVDRSHMFQCSFDKLSLFMLYLRQNWKTEFNVVNQDVSSNNDIFNWKN